MKYKNSPVFTQIQALKKTKGLAGLGGLLHPPSNRIIWIMVTHRTKISGKHGSGKSTMYSKIATWRHANFQCYSLILRHSLFWWRLNKVLPSTVCLLDGFPNIAFQSSCLSHSDVSPSSLKFKCLSFVKNMFIVHGLSVHYVPPKDLVHCTYMNISA